MTFKAYMDNIEKQTGKSPEDFWKMARKKGFVKGGKVVASYADMMKWLKSKDVKLGHVRASAMTLYLRVRGKDPTVTKHSRDFANMTWKF